MFLFSFKFFEFQNQNQTDQSIITWKDKVDDKAKEQHYT